MFETVTLTPVAGTLYVIATVVGAIRSGMTIFCTIVPNLRVVVCEGTLRLGLRINVHGDADTTIPLTTVLVEVVMVPRVQVPEMLKMLLVPRTV
jgi:hypothetical protein